VRTTAGPALDVAVRVASPHGVTFHGVTSPRSRTSTTEAATAQGRQRGRRHRCRDRPPVQRGKSDSKDAAAVTTAHNPVAGHLVTFLFGAGAGFDSCSARRVRWRASFVCHLHRWFLADRCSEHDNRGFSVCGPWQGPEPELVRRSRRLIAGILGTSRGSRRSAMTNRRSTLFVVRSFMSLDGDSLPRKHCFPL